jgi:hypothetical protein
VNNEEIEKQKAEDSALFESDIKACTEKWADHKRKEFTFSAFEQQLLAEQETIVALAQRTKLKVLNDLAVKRVGLEPNPLIKLRYHIGLGRFVVFVPNLPKTEKKIDSILA